MHRTTVTGVLLLAPLLCTAGEQIDIDVVLSEITAEVARISPHVDAGSAHESGRFSSPPGRATVAYFPHAAVGDEEYYVEARCSESVDPTGWECEAVVNDRPRRPEPEFHSPPAQGGACLGIRPLSFLEVERNGGGCWEYSGIDHGVAMWGVSHGSPADAAGIRTGDFLVSFNDVALEASGVLASVLENMRPGGPFSARLYRHGEFFDVTGDIGVFDDDMCLASNDSGP